jgi:hypothetical protein
MTGNAAESLENQAAALEMQADNVQAAGENAAEMADETAANKQ